MEALYAIQKDLKKQITNSYANFKKKGAGKMTIIAAQARLSGLEKAFAQFEATHQKILSSKDVPENHEYFVSNLSDQVIDTFYDQKGEFLQAIEDMRQIERERDPPPSPVNIGQSLNASSASLEAHSLPKMNLPKFSGKFTEWENFRDLFRSIVHRRADLDASIKYYHLRSSLVGEALDHIKSIPIAADQYETAWQTLISYYDNKRRSINTLISSIMSIKPMKAETDAELKRVYREMFSTVESLRKLGRSDAEIGNDILIYIAVELLEVNTKREWKKSIDKSNDTPPTLVQLKTFISGQIENLDEGRDLQTSSSKSKNSKKAHGNSESTTVQSLQTSSKTSKPVSCALCNAEHYLAKCEQFGKKSIAERREFAKSKHLCFNCLSSGHPQTRCKSKYSCFTCKRKHHTLLHLEDSSAERGSSVANPPSPTNGTHVISENASVNSATQESKPAGVLLATALVCVTGPKNVQLYVRALVDPCSQVTLVSENLCNQLSLSVERTDISLKGVGEQTSLRVNRLASLQLRPHFESRFILETKALVLKKISSYKPPVVQSVSSLKFLEGLQLADPHFLQQARVELLLGADVYSEILEDGIVKGTELQPMAIQSKLGWLLTGKIENSNARVPAPIHTATVLHSASVSNQELSDLLREFWRTEEVPMVKNSRTQEDEACESLYQNTTTRDQRGRYSVRLPWKDPDSLGNLRLGSSFPHALSALKRLEASFQKDERLKSEYTKFIQEYIDLGHMTPIEEIASSESDYFFLPHHGVWKETSTTTKLRTVFNGSSKLDTGNSLNDLLYSGTNLLLNPVVLICRIRFYVIALSADVEKMYRQVGMHPDDRKYQAILWRFSPLGRIIVYLLNTVTYGLAPSQYLAIRTLLQMATDHEKEHPLAATVVREEMYSDNALTGAHSVDEAKDKIEDLVSLFAKAQMNLRKWASNEPRALSALAENMLAEDKITLFSSDSATPLLGIAWHTNGDYFCFRITDQEIPKSNTKRGILSRIARTYDPLGWISPVVITAKILLQSLWLQKVDWDDPLPKDVLQLWERWLSELPAVSYIKIPRWIGYAPGTSAELHGFADASKKAYGAVVYLRLTQDQNVFTSLQIAKSKVAPVKTLSIPRLELCASLLLTRLASQFLDSSPLPIQDVHLWTDSADVLFWLRDQPSRWVTFIANRCSAIHTVLPNAYWHHVRSKENPADLVSRGIEPSKLHDNDLWWKGPSFLTEKAGAWSKNQDELNFTVENVVVVNACSTAQRLTRKDRQNGEKADKESQESKVWSLVKEYSSLIRLLKVTSYCLRFLTKISIRIRSDETRILEMLGTPFLKGNLDYNGRSTNSAEIDNARSFWCCLVQRCYFPNEYKLLIANKRLSDKNPLASLNPFVENCLIKVGGRLSNALSDDQAKHPVILPRTSTLTSLFIRQAHLLALHGGTQLTLATLRNQVWIVRGRTEVRRLIRQCVLCARYSSKIPSQLMGELPSARVRPANPFQKAGVDYAGPINVRLTKSRGKGTLKGYICIFVCMATKAVHLELVEDYSSESFIAAFHRFTARRGHCRELYSDQGTNFKGADAELKAMLKEGTEYHSKIKTHLISAGTDWHFNPPSAPHFGGLWEAGVKSLKYHLKRVVGEQALTFSELATLLCRIEACLNSRPLLALSDDPSDLNFLTPAHFLIQSSSYLVPEPDVADQNIPIGKRWQLVPQMTQHIWSRWRNEYLTALQTRNKWLNPGATLKVDDVVLIINENTPPGKWPMARVLEVHPGKDNRVRVVTVRTSTGLLQRPIVKLVPLPVDTVT